MVTSRRARHEDAPVRITTAPTSHHDDIARRRRRYLVSMAIRTACFIGAVVADGWLRWVLVVAAFILPYIAVVMANVASPRIEGADLVPPDSGRRELGE
ncbi:MAG: DUF3099 domain-containing protein [Marmoricola sp.]